MIVNKQQQKKKKNKKKKKNMHMHTKPILCFSKKLFSPKNQQNWGCLVGADCFGFRRRFMACVLFVVITLPLGVSGRLCSLIVTLASCFKRRGLTLLLLDTTCPVLANSVDPDQLASEEAN